MNHNDKYPLDDLFEALQHQCDRIDQYADQHPVSNEVIKRSIGHPSLHRRLLLSSAFSIAMSTTFGTSSLILSSVLSFSMALHPVSA